MSNLRIVFMGTSGFAVPSLARLIETGYQVVGVITAPDKPAGRGQRLAESPVKKYALDNNIPLLQPSKLQDISFQNELTKLQGDLQVVVAFRMLPPSIWKMPRHGTINLHASLLPQYRGAAPINWAIINGEEHTGVTTFYIDHEIDTGNIILQKKERILPDETAGDLHDKLMVSGADLIVKTVEAIESGVVEKKEQKDEGSQKNAPKINKSNCKINWDNDLSSIYNFVRGLSPYPAAYTTLQERSFKIFTVSKEEISHGNRVGTIISDKHNVKVAVRDGYIHLLEIQLEGKKRMGISEFIKGYRFDKNIQFDL